MAGGASGVNNEAWFREHWATDHVRGQIIGGDRLDCGLFYEGRPQGKRWSADTMDDAKAKAAAALSAIKAECGHAYEMIYRDAGAWEMRVWG